MPHMEKLNDLLGRTMVNIVSGESLHIYDKNSSRLPKPPGWLSFRTTEDEIDRVLSRSESKFCTPNGTTCMSKTIGLLVIAGTLSPVNFVTSEKRHPRTRQTVLICPCWRSQELWTSPMRLAASTNAGSTRITWKKSGHRQKSFRRGVLPGDSDSLRAQ